MKAVAYCPLRDSEGKHDAREFRDEARRFLKLHCGDERTEIVYFDNREDLGERRAQVLSHLESMEPRSLETLVFACHGWPDGIQAGFRCEHVRGLARQLKETAAPRLTVVLYCCSTGADQAAATDERQPGPGGDGGFADRLRDELAELGVAVTVFAHSVAGHTTRNPYVRVFRPDERAGGRWLVEPGSELWPAWLRGMHGGDLRFKYPMMSHEKLQAELRG